MLCRPSWWHCAHWYSRGGEVWSACPPGRASPVWPPTPSWQSHRAGHPPCSSAVFPAPHGLSKCWKCPPWAQAVLGAVQGVWHPPGMMSQQCLPLGQSLRQLRPAFQPRCLGSPSLKETTGHPTVHLLQHPPVHLPSPWQQQGGPWKGREVLVDAGSWAGPAGGCPATGGNTPQHISDPTYNTLRAGPNIRIFLCSKLPMDLYQGKNTMGSFPPVTAALSAHLILFSLHLHSIPCPTPETLTITWTKMPEFFLQN